MPTTVWIMNHYAGTPEDSDTLRHYYFAKKLIKKGYKVTVFAASTIHNTDIQRIKGREEYTEKNVSGVPFVFIKTREYKGNGMKRILNMTDYYFRMLKNADKFETPDIIWGSSVHPLACVAAIRLSEKFRCKNICEIRDLWPESIVVYGKMTKRNLIIRLLYLLEKWIYKSADELIFTMQGGWKYIQDMGWQNVISREKVHFVNNGVDLREYKYNECNFQLDDPDLLNEKNFKVIYTGSVRKSNNLSLLVDAAGKLQRECEKLRVIVYGQGDELEELKKKADKEKITNVIFKGKVEKKYIPFILSKSDLNVTDIYNSPLFRYGVSPNKLFDYLASGKRILMGLNCNYDLVTNYDCGYKLEKCNSEELSDQIKAFYYMPEERRKEMEGNAEKAAQQYDYERLVEKIIDIIK